MIDDIDLGITHVVRGEDHVSNSAAQIQMFEALGAAPPAFAHEALLVAAEGKLSKRLGSYGAEHLREEGVEPMALLSLLARIGTSQPVEPAESLDALAAGFRLRLLCRAPAHSTRTTSSAQRALAPYLDFRAVPIDSRKREEADWLLLRPTSSGSTTRAWFPVVGGESSPPSSPREAAFVREQRWSPVVSIGAPSREGADRDAEESTGRQGRELFHPLRLALTGRENGPRWRASCANGKGARVRRLKLGEALAHISLYTCL